MDVATASLPVYRAHAVTRTYLSGAAEVCALRGIDLEVGPGEFIVMLGPSGSGKSTLFSLLGGRATPTTGSLFWRDLDLGRASETQRTLYRRLHVGFVFQFYNLIPSLTAVENVALVTEIAANPMDPHEALALVGLSERAEHFPAQLSGGEQQRVAIARAIAKRPDVLLCDEPTGALDVHTGITVLEAIERINRELGTLAVIITHNAILADMADRVFTLSDGRIVHARENATRGSVRDLAW